MFKECCLECGHLLSKQGTFCPFCGWDLQDEQLVDNLETDRQLHGLYLADIEPDQLFESNTFQSAGL